MSDKNGRRRRGPWMAITIAVVLMLLLIETAVVVGIFVSPRAADQLRTVASSASRTWNGADGNPGVRARSVRGLQREFRDWIEPLWSHPGTTPKDPQFTE